MGLFGVLIIASPVGIRFFYGTGFQDSASLLPILLIAVMFVSIAYGAATTLQTTKARGPRAVAALNVAGLVVSLVRLGVDGIRPGHHRGGPGYLVGSTTTSIGLIVTVWRVEHQHWWDLTARLAGGVVLVVAASVATSGLTGISGAVIQLGTAAAFGGVWMLLTRRDVVALWSTLRGRGRSAATG